MITGEIEVLPALPSEWKSGSINGLMARTRVEVRELVWDTNVVCVTIKSVADHNEIKLKAGIPWTKAMVNAQEVEALDDEYGKHIRLTLNSGIDVTVAFTLPDSCAWLYRKFAAVCYQNSLTPRIIMQFAAFQAMALFEKGSIEDPEFDIQNV